eukprot:Tamp_40050.p2 GENE.Tamp_40050~~Tamp_40050.p2  ORF type:complete len:118 (+),score=2.95 Tamp_40050:79-432(+)
MMRGHVAGVHGFAAGKRSTSCYSRHGTRTAHSTHDLTDIHALTELTRTLLTHSTTPLTNSTPSATRIPPTTLARRPYGMTPVRRPRTCKRQRPRTCKRQRPARPRPRERERFRGVVA